MLEIITIGNEILREKASLVSDINSEIEQLVAQMQESLQIKRGLGLAAPQVSVKKRIFITNTPDEGLRVFINPDIIQTSFDQELYEEGCLSVPGVYGNILRPSEVTIQAWNLKGKVFRIDADGLLARVIQHEFDHLNGVLFPDRMEEKQRERLMKLYNRKSRE